MQYLPTSKAAVYLHVTPQTVVNMIKRGELQAIRPGRNYKIPISELYRILGEHFPLNAA